MALLLPQVRGLKSDLTAICSKPSSLYRSMQPLSTEAGAAGHKQFIMGLKLLDLTGNMPLQLPKKEHKEQTAKPTMLKQWGGCPQTRLH